jgi:hypothetical protein
MKMCSEIFEGRILRSIYGPIKENGVWRLGHNHELYKLCNESDHSRAIEMIGTTFRMQEQNPCRKLTLHKPEGTRRVGKPEVRWLDSVKENLKTMGFRNLRQRSQDRDQWRAIVKEARVHLGLYRPQKKKKT